MVNTVSPFFDDDDLVTQLMIQFDEEEMHTMDYKTIFNQIEDIGDCLQLRLRGKLFNIDKVTGVVSEVKV